jgi:hypothetical protein
VHFSQPAPSGTKFNKNHRNLSRRIKGACRPGAGHEDKSHDDIGIDLNGQAATTMAATG